jgi:ESS family glutamate:Na+ symporter
VLQLAGGALPAGWTAGWSRLPGLLINAVFAALFLGVAVPPLRTLWRRAGSQFAYGQIVAWGQYVVGLGLVLFVLGPLFGVPALFGVIVPVGFEGGHGTAGGLAPTFREIGWGEGADYALASATAGIVSAIVVGMALVNWAARTGRLPRFRPFNELGPDESAGIYPVDSQPAAGRQTVAADSVDSLALHLAVMGLAVLAGYGIKTALVAIETHLPGAGDRAVMRAFPLFPLCMVGGLLVQALLARTGRAHLVDHGLMQRIAGTALDFLVVAAVSTIRLEVVAEGFVPFLVIVAGGIAWNVFCVVWLAPRLLPDAWFERGVRLQAAPARAVHGRGTVDLGRRTACLGAGRSVRTGRQRVGHRALARGVGLVPAPRAPTGLNSGALAAQGSDRRHLDRVRAADAAEPGTADGDQRIAGFGEVGGGQRAPRGGGKVVAGADAGVQDRDHAPEEAHALRGCGRVGKRQHGDAGPVLG